MLHVMQPDVATRGCGRYAGGATRGVVALSLRRSTLRAGTLYIRTRAREGVFMVTSRGCKVVKWLGEVVWVGTI